MWGQADKKWVKDRERLIKKVLVRYAERKRECDW